MLEQKAERPVSIAVLALLLALFGVFAFVGSVFLWGQGSVFAAPEGTDIAFAVTDIVVNAPASWLTAIGLWQLRRFGYLGSYFVAGFYVYASVYILVEVFQGGAPYAIEIAGPQLFAILMAVALLIFPRRYKDRFS
jgi:hypothetical protein